MISGIVSRHLTPDFDLGITKGRVYQDGMRELIQISPEQLDENYWKLQVYADMLDSGMDGTWLNVYLP